MIMRRVLHRRRSKAKIDERVVLHQREGESPDAECGRTNLPNHVRRQDERGKQADADTRPVPKNIFDESDTAAPRSGSGCFRIDGVAAIHAVPYRRYSGTGASMPLSDNAGA